jgi:Tfp pilus assembly protein PilF
LGNTLNNLGALYWQQGKIAEAEPLYQRALFIQEKTAKIPPNSKRYFSKQA